MLRFVILASSDAPAEASLAAASVRRHHPEAQVSWLMTDPRAGAASFVAPGDLVTFAHTVTLGELDATDLLIGLSPAAMRWGVLPAVVGGLLGEDPEATVVTMSATSELFGPLDDLLARADGATLLLPARFDRGARSVAGGWIPEFGIFGPRSRGLLTWWVAEARRWALRDDVPEEDRRSPWRSYLDHAPDLVIGGEGRYRVHPVAVDELRLDIAEADIARSLVDGRPLAVLHAPEFDPLHPWRYGDDVAVSDIDGLRALLHHRANSLRAAGWTPRADSTAPVAGWRSGEVLAREYRRALRAAAEGAERPPNPFRSGEVARFLEWSCARSPSSSTGVSRIADDLWARRGDLDHAFPSVRWRDRSAFGRWLWTSGISEGEISLAVLPDPPAPRPMPRRTPRAERPFGVNLIGYHGSDAGLGVAVRRVARALDAAEIPWSEFAYDRTDSRQRDRGTTRPADAPFRVNLILITADQLPLFVADAGREVLEDRYNIGLWYWETDVMTSSQRASFDLVDEVWGATTYLRDVFAAQTRKPVIHQPIPLVFPDTPDRATARRRLGFDDRFTVLFSFDFLSISYRKNPLGLLDAFHRAFPDGSARLILKSINGDRRLDEKEELADAVAGVAGAELWDRYLDGDERLALVAAADCYASLHRSEGLGLTIAEAMAAGTPVIATDYSGTTDLTVDGSALLVDAVEVEIGSGHYYPPEGHWAEPDLDQAAAHLRRLAADPELRERLAAAGRRSVARFDPRRVGDSMERRLRVAAGD